MNSYNTYSDERLIELIREDNRLAFTEIFNRYWERLTTLAASKLPSPDDAQEVVQNLFIDLWKRRSALKLEYSFNTYITAALRYNILRHLATRARRLSKHQESLRADMDYSTEEWLSFEELKDRLNKHIAELPEKCRLVFELSRKEGFTEKQIAQHLQISTKTVEAHLSKARRSLRI
ncbi:MAG: sigma-70 family RNA polymerase sigma factor, partial [Chitinophagaceae bacterium]|nr:sigma-70 family RNA polymerase sigma factor [Chitinophagaceae bacterium]